MMPVLKTAPQIERLSSLVTTGGISLDATQIVVLVVLVATLALLWYANRPSTIQRYSVDRLEREDKDAPDPASSRHEAVTPRDSAATLPEAPANSQGRLNQSQRSNDVQ